MNIEDECLSLVVKSIRQRPAFVKEFELRSPNGLELPPFEPGAHVEVVTGNGTCRAYSLVNRSDERNRYVIAVQLRLGSTSGSQYLHDFVEVGDQIEVGTPRNSFPLDISASESILVAAGIGITPLLSMARKLKALNCRFTLHYIAKSINEMSFLDEVMDEVGANAVVHPTRATGLGRPRLDQLVGNYAVGKKLYVCGPSGMVTAVRNHCVSWPVDAVRYELFVNRRGGTRKIAQPAESFQVMLARSGRVLNVPADATLLEVLTGEGIRIPSACASGYCGTCVVPLLAGNADHRDTVLTPADRVNRIQTCCSRAQSGERLVIDR
ncbi:PDR/VanB family oxidoreductase [Pigmentiphaga litoralis]|uniref:PDR/VanB family oxidoreductase n=1 Tax=Pigmentiphaga litoralis TaxID=516702 RepID=UPI0016764359|nr:PDR/VanB family oxidoreductase [Pigmentiphaga litoralis]